MPLMLIHRGTSAVGPGNSAVNVLRVCNGKLARLLLDCLDQNQGSANLERMKITMTHEEMAQMIGTSRETITRALGDPRRRRMIQQDGSILMIRNRTALRALILPDQEIYAPNGCHEDYTVFLRFGSSQECR